ncbi:MAG: HYR domain-containing protein [Draconibacterium sp.]|nr:HYR domain-containing protein [Draconibacterium sp.]
MSHNSIFSTNTTNADGTYPVGTTTVIWTATDLSGNTTTCCRKYRCKGCYSACNYCPDDVSGFCQLMRLCCYRR